MRKLANNEFDPKAFLAKVGAGKTILKFEKNQHVLEQGDVADTVFYIQKGSVKLTVLSEQGKEAVVGILETGQFFGEAVSMAIDCASRPQWPLRYRLVRWCGAPACNRSDGLEPRPFAKESWCRRRAAQSRLGVNSKKR